MANTRRGARKEEERRETDAGGGKEGKRAIRR